MEKAKVFFTDFRTQVGTSMTEKLKKLCLAAGFKNIDMEGKFVAIKMHFGELGNLAYLRPQYAKAVADLVKAQGGIPFLTDCNTLYPGSRKHALEHLDCANLNGFNTVTTGCQIIIADGLRGTDEVEVPVKNAVVEDVIPTGLDFQAGSVQINGQATTDYTYDEASKALKVMVGNIAAGAEVKVTFIAAVNKDAFNKSIKNVTTVTSDNCDPEQAQTTTDVEDGKADLTVKKTADKKTAKVGDTIVYTITASNAVGADVDVRDSVFFDTIPAELTFTGNVQVDGSSRSYSYDAKTRELKITLGNIAPGQTKTIQVSTIVNSSAYGKDIENTAIVKSANLPDKEGTAEVTTIEPGSAEGHVGAKTVDKKTAKAGETVTYTIALTNASYATADWIGAQVKDQIPDGMTFLWGSWQALRNRHTATRWSIPSATAKRTAL